MLLRVLGPVVLCDPAGSTIALAPQKRELLAMLAATPGMQVSRSAICEALWGDESATHLHRLKSQVAQLRSLLPLPLGIDFINGGYLLTGTDEALDSSCFLRTTMAPTSPTESRAALLRALRWWTSPAAFADVDNIICAAAAYRLSAQRERAILTLAAWEAADPSTSESIELLSPIFDEDPTRGDVAVALAQVLAATHRQLDAVRVIGRHRAALAAMGAVVSASIDATESALLRQDRVGSTPVPTSPRRERSAVLVERPAVVAVVSAALRNGPVCLIGEAGAGKSTLALMVTNGWAAAEPPVIVETSSAPSRPMQAIHQLVRGLLAGQPDHEEALLARPELADAWMRVTGEQPHGAALVSREELMSALVDLLDVALGGRDRLIVVEDLHHLDPTSVSVLERLVRRRRPPMLITSRVPPGWAESDLTCMIVPPMSLEEVTVAAAALLPEHSVASLPVQVHRRSGGNALFVNLLLEISAAADGDLPLPSTLQLALSARLAGLSSASLAVMNAAALLGDTFDVRAVRGVVAEAKDGLEDGVRQGLLVVEGHRGKFVHELIAEALVDALPSGQRIDLHDRLCEQLQECGAAATEIARQAVAAAVLDPERAARTALVVANQYGSVFDWTEVIRWADLGLESLPGALPTHVVVIDLLTARGTARRRLGVQGSDVDLLEAARHALKCDDAARLVAAATELCLHGPTSASGFADERAQDVLEQALAADTDTRAQIRLMAAAATLFTMSSEWERGRELFHRSLDSSERLGDPDVRREVLLNSHLGLSHPDDLGHRRVSVRELAQYDDADAQWETAFLGFGVALVDGDRERLDGTVRQMRTRIGSVAQRGRGSGMLQVESVSAFLRGAFDEAEALADKALQVTLAGSSESWALSVYAGLIYPIRDAQDRLVELRPAVLGLLAAQPDFPLWLAVDAAIAVRLGDMDRGRAVIAKLATEGFPFIHDLTWSGLVVLTMRTACAVGDEEAASTLYRMLLPHQGLMSWNGLSTHGPIDAALALAASLLGDTNQAAAHLKVADELIARLQAPHLRWPELAPR